MKTGITLSELASELERQQTTKEDLIVDTRNLQLNSPTDRNWQSGQFHLQVDNKSFPVNENTHQQLASRLEIPKKYYDKMINSDPDLLATNVNHWFHTTPQKRMVRTLDGIARAFLSDRYQRIDNYDVATVVLPILQKIEGLSFKSMQITENRMYIKVVSQETKLEVKSRRVNDFVESGVMISNSEIGLGSLKIEPFFHFLVCTNGMVRSKDGFTKYHLGRQQTIEGENLYKILSDDTKKLEDAAILSKVKDVLNASMNKVKFEEAIHQFQQTTNRFIEGDIPKTIEKVAETVKLTQPETSLVLKHLIESGDTSQYGVVNAITRTAEDVDSYDRATELETIGGQVIDLSETEFKRLNVA